MTTRYEIEMLAIELCKQEQQSDYMFYHQGHMVTWDTFPEHRRKEYRQKAILMLNESYTDG